MATASGDTNKEKLIRFLERRAWNPILKASPKRYAGAEVKRLERVQTRLRQAGNGEEEERAAKEE